MRRYPVRALIAALTLGWLTPAWAGPEVTLIGSYTWSVEDDNFGGFSALEVDAAGSGFLALTDRGHAVSGRLLRTGDAITAVEARPMRPLVDLQLRPIASRVAGDAEGLAVDAAGNMYVSFEAWHRVWRYGPDGRVTKLSGNGVFRGLSYNGGLEALAVDPAGRLFVIPERSGTIRESFPVYVLENETWSVPYSIPRTAGFLPTAADFGPDGRLYLLEREFNGFGFRSQIRRFDIGASGPENETLLLQTRAGTHDNLEGLSAWQDGDGRIRLTMISDDNFQFFQRTEFVEYAVTE